MLLHISRPFYRHWDSWCVHYLWHPVMPFEWSRVRNLSSLSTYIVSNPVSIVKFYLKFLYFFFDTQHLVYTIDHIWPGFLCWFFGRISFDYFIFNSLTQQVHQFSSVGAGSFPLLRDSERGLRVDSVSPLTKVSETCIKSLSHSLVILYHKWGIMSSFFRFLFNFL